MTALVWQRPIANGTGKKYHLVNAGTPVCGTRITTGLTWPRELTERQIRTQACGKCVNKNNEGNN